MIQSPSPQGEGFRVRASCILLSLSTYDRSLNSTDDSDVAK